MKYSLFNVTALTCLIYAVNANAINCDGNHCYSGDNLVISVGSFNKNNLPAGFKEYDEDNEIYSYNYHRINMTGGSLNLTDFKIRSYIDSAISGGTITIKNGGFKAKNDNFIISGGTINASSDSEIDGKYTTISGNTVATLNNAYIGARNELKILGGTMNLTNAALYASLDKNDYGEHPVVRISGGTINLKGNSYIISEIEEELGNYNEICTASEGHITGGTINVTAGKNGLVLDNPDFGGTLNIAQGSTFSVWENYYDNDDTAEFYNKGGLNVTENGTINLNGGKLEADVAGNGLIYVKTAGSKIDGDFDGLDLYIAADTTLSKFITGNIYSYGSLYLQKGALTIDKLPEDEDSALESFTMEQGTLKGYGIASNGEVNIKSGTINVSDGIYVENKSFIYSADAADMNISGGNITVTGISEDGKKEAGEITLTGNGEMNISGANTVVNMNFSGINGDNDHDGGILHEGKTGNINIEGGTFNLTGKTAKIERGGYDGDWIYDREGNALILEDDFHDITGKWMTEGSVTDQDFIDAGLNPQTVDRDQYHVSEGDINISGGTINLKEGARISNTAKNSGDINITGGTIKTIKNTAYKEDYGRITHLGSGDLNIKGNAVINMEKGNIKKGNHGDDSERTKGNINIGENAKITLYNDSHINSDQDVNVSGGTINLYNDATLEGYGNFTVSGGTITVGRMTDAPSDDDDVWSAIGSNYKDGNVTISGGNITLNNNGSLDRSVHIDDDMDIGQLEGEISGNMEISGGTITANGNSIILLGWGDGTDIHGNDLEEMIASGEVLEKGDIIIGGNAIVTLNDDASILHKTIGKVEITGGKVNLNGNSAIRAEHDGVVEINGGELNLDGNAQIYTDNNFHRPADVSVSNSAALNVKGDNLINNGITLSSAELNIATGATLTLQKNGNIGLVNASGKADIELQGTLNADINGNNDSVLVIKGTDAKLNGNATDLATLSFENAQTSFADQSLTANEISLDHSTLTFNGGVIMASLNDDITLSNGSLIKIVSGENTINSARNIIMNGSDLEIKHGASLDLNVSEDGYVNFNGGKIYLLGELTGNVIADELYIGDKDAIIRGKGRYHTVNIAGKTGNISSFITDNIDVGDLNITSGSNITLDKANTLVVKEEDNRKYVYSSGYYNGKRYTLMSDENDFLDEDGEIDYDEIDEDETLKNYENQINGRLTIDNSVLTLKTNLAADEFVVTNRATLNAQNQIIGGRALYVNNNSTANLQHTGSGLLNWNESGFSDSIVVDNNSTLNVTAFDIGQNWDCSGDVKILNGSTLNITDDGFNSYRLTVDNSTLKAKNGEFGAKYNDGNPAAVFNNSIVDMDSSSSYTHGIAGLYNGTEATLKNNSDFAANEMDIQNSTVEAFGNSHIGAFKNAVNIDVEDEAIYNNINHGLFLRDQTDLDVENSTVTLNGDSELGVAMAITEWDDRDYIIGYLTPEIVANPELLKQLKSKYKNYEMVSHHNYDEDHSADFDDGFDEAADYKAQVNIKGSNIVLNDNAKIVNAMLNVEKDQWGGDSGNINITDGSTVTVNGNNTLSANKKVRVYDSTVVVNNGATLNIESSRIKAENEDKEISTKKIILSDSAIELNGTLNADIEGKSDADLHIFGNAVLNGNAIWLTEIQFDEAITSLQDQTLSATDIALVSSTVNMRGDADLSADNRLSLSDSTINVSGKYNKIYVGNTLDLTDSVINIKRNAGLNFNVADGGVANLVNSYINVYVGSDGGYDLQGNIANLAQLTILTGPDIQHDEYDVAANATKLSSIISGTITDLGDLVIDGNKNLTIDKEKLFLVSKENEDYIRQYETGYEGRKKYYADQTNFSSGEYYYDEYGNIHYEDDDDDNNEPINYENQIAGTLKIQNSNVTSATNFAAEDVVVDDHSTLTLNDRIIGAHTLTVNNGSKVNLKSNSTYALSGFDDSVTVSDNSTLTTGFFMVGTEDENEEKTKINVSGNSIYNAVNGEIHAGEINLNNSTLNATNSRVKAVGNGLNFDASALNASGSFVQSESDVFVGKNGDKESVINLKANSTLMADQNMDLYNSTVVAENSSIGAFRHAVKIDAVDKEVKNKIEHHYWNGGNQHEPEDIITDIDGANITLKGNSRLGTGLAISYWKGITSGVIEGFITRNMYENPDKFLKDRRFNGYDIDDEFENGFDDAMNYKGYLTIADSNIVLDGSSSIINAALNVAGDDMSGDIQIYNSEIEVKGNNTALSAAKDIKLTDSTLKVLRGAVLNIASDTAQSKAGKDITLDGTSLDLAGVIKGNVTFADSGDKIGEFILNGGRIEGKVSGISALALGAGQNGKTSATMKGMQFSNLKELTIAGTTAANGKVTAPNIILDSAVFAMDNDAANRKYYAYDKKAKGYINAGTWEYAQHYAYDDRYDVRAFDNQINGDVILENGASLTLNSALAANKFDLNNNAVLTVNNTQIDGHLSLNNNSTATISGGKTSDLSMGMIELNNNSTLNLKNTDWMGIYSLSSDSSKLNISGTDLDPLAGISLKDTITTLSSSVMWENDSATNRTLNIDGGTLTATASQIGFFNTSVGDAIITASKGSSWAVGNAEINGATVTLNDGSKIFTGEYDDEDADNKAEYFNEFTERYENNRVNMNFADSTLNLNGTSAVELAVINDNRIDLHGDIIFNNSEVNMNGTSQIVNTAQAGDENGTSGYLAFGNGSTLNIKGKNNVLSATNTVGISGSTLNILKGANLTVKSSSPHEDYKNTFHAVNSNIILSGVLNGNLSIDDDLYEDDEELDYKTSLTMNGGRVNGKIIGLNELALGAGQSGKTSSSLKGTEFENIKGLTIAGTTAANGKITAPNITLDSAVFTVSDDKSPRWYGYDEYEKMYFDLGTEYPDDYYHNEEFMKYDNQILGDVNVSNRATLNVNKALATENINVDNATFVSNNGLLYGNLNLNNNAVATINGSMLDLLMQEINVDSSTLNLNALEYMRVANISLTGSKLNTSKYAEIDIENNEGTGEIEAIDSTINIGAGGSWINGNSIFLSHSNAKIADADVRFGSSLIGFSDATLSKNTIFGAGNAVIQDSIVTLNDKSRLVTNFTEVSKNYLPEMVNVTDYFGEDSPARDSSMEFVGATINLNGSSSIERNVLFENADGKGRGEILPAIVSGMTGNIVADSSVFNMTGTSSIKNLAEADGKNSGNIIFEQGSTLNVKGKNVLEANGNITFKDSTLDVAQGGVLSVYNSDDTINVENARLKLSGTLNADISGTIDTLIYGAKGNLNGYMNLSESINSFGVSGANTKTLNNLLKRFVATDMETFEITDKSNLVYNDALEENLSFNNLNVENSTLTISGDRRLNGDLTADSGSAIKINNATDLMAQGIYLQDSSLTVSGAAPKKGQAQYQTFVRTDNGIHIDNTNNAKAGVSIANAEIVSDMSFNNVNKTTLSNIDALAYNINISGDVTKNKKGNNVYKTATLSNVSAEKLTVDDINATFNSGYFNNINITDEGLFNIKGKLDTYLTLSDSASAVLAAGKHLYGNVDLGGEKTLLNVQGIVDADITGNGTLRISNNKALINGYVDGVNLDLLKIKTSLSNVFKGSVANIASVALNGSTVTADHYGINNFGGLKLEKSSLILKNDVFASDLYANASTLNLGTNVLTVHGDATLDNATSVVIQVNDADTYGQLDVNGNLTLTDNAKGKPTNNLAVTLKKGIQLSKDDEFKFLNYETVDGQLNKVTIANNRYTFEEQKIGQFIITNATSGKGVIKRYDSASRNAMRAAAALVDNNQPLSAPQAKLAENLNTLSQVVGGEDDYIQALNAAGPDDNNMVSENTVSTVNTVISAASDRISSAGISSSAQGMSSGDAFNGAALWTKVLYNQGKLDNSASFAGFKSRQRGLALGGDKMLNNNVKLGLGYAYTKGKITNSYRRSDVDTHTAMIYGEYKPSDWFVNAVAGYGWSDYENKAYSVLGTTRSDFDVYTAAVQVNTGYDINFAKDTVLTPVAGMRYTHIARDAYTDSDDKRISKQNSNIVTALTGAKLKKTFALDAGAYITPEARLGVTYDVKRDADNSVVKLSNGSSYVVEGRALHRFALEAGAGITASFDNGIELTAGYEGRFRKDYRDHTGLLNCKYSF